MRKIKLASPYGYLTTPGGGRIENGRRGVVVENDRCEILFEGELLPVQVPAHWQSDAR